MEDIINPWIQVDFGVLRTISGVVLQGRSDVDHWVTQYKVQHSVYGIYWLTVKDMIQEHDMVGKLK